MGYDFRASELVPDVHDMSLSKLDFLLGVTHQNIIHAENDHPEDFVGFECECGSKFQEDADGYLGCPSCE